MVFSSSTFIFCFLPLLIIIYFAVPRKYIAARNVILLIFSLGFYAWGEPKFVFIMMFSILSNYIFGRLIDGIRKNRKLTLATAIIFNLGLLGVFKYLNFIILNINRLLIHVTEFQFTQTSIALPIGISFFTFQALSYIIDVYRGKTKVQCNLLYLALYISFFPQLIAGPIVRYTDIENEILNRKESVADFSEGVRRFVYGLGKKVILANNLALVADKAFTDVSNGSLTVAMAWLGMIAYSLQIYYDFSGYSDMAIGLGRMFGFHFNENFNYPYMAKSISEFWRRWHISLGSWFKDYVYIPVGGSHVSKTKIIRNLFIVWFLTGLWHGANWTFIVWGLIYFLLISFEKIVKINSQFNNKFFTIGYRAFTLFSVGLLWIFFRADGLTQGISYASALLNINSEAIWDYTFIEYGMENIFFIGVGIFLAIPILDVMKKKLKLEETVIMDAFRGFTCIMILVIAVCYIVLEVYNPFIYFNF